MVIAALGFDAENLPARWDTPDLTTTRWGTIRTDARHATALPGVYACGDIARGASLVVWAIRDGREAAQTMLDHMAQTAIAAE